MSDAPPSALVAACFTGLLIVLVLAGCGGREQPRARQATHRQAIEPPGEFQAFCRANPGTCDGGPPRRACANDPIGSGRVDGAMSWIARDELLLTTNGGRSFRRACGPAGITGDIVVPAPGTLVAAAGSGVLRSTDSGRHWRRIRLGAPVVDLVARDGRARALESTCGAHGERCPVQIAGSRDAGRHWASRTLGPGKRDVVGLPSPSLSFADASHGVASLPGGELATTGDGGERWNRRHSPCVRNETPSAAAFGRRDVWVACGGRPGAGNQAKSLYRSADDGRSFRLVRGHGAPGPDRYALPGGAPSETSSWSAPARGTRPWSGPASPSPTTAASPGSGARTVEHRRPDEHRNADRDRPEDGVRRVQQHRRIFRTTDAGGSWKTVRTPG